VRPHNGSAEAEPDEVNSVDQLVELVGASGTPTYVRFSADVAHDRVHGSVDHESGLPLPGLSVNPLQPPSWWRKPLRAWVVRQLCTYHHLKDQDDDRRCWIVVGSVIDRGPDNEPLLTDVRAIAVVADDVLDECRQREDASPRGEDAANDDGSAPWQSTSSS
jgi:Family of unknown function (DUF6098)